MGLFGVIGGSILVFIALLVMLFIGIPLMKNDEGDAGFTVLFFSVLGFVLSIACIVVHARMLFAPTMSVIEKRKEIAILMTMGARRVGVMKMFLVQGMLVGAFGTFFGALAAVFTAYLLEHIGFGIPGDVYYITNLPVHVGVGDVVLVVIAALLIVWDFAVFPALRGSRLEPVEGLRDG